MLNWVAKRRFNILDSLVFLFAWLLMVEGNWGGAVVLFVVGALLSGWVEGMAKKKRTKAPRTEKVDA